MSTFMVDMRFYAHVKAVRAGAAALGLWVLCGSHCSHMGTNGIVHRSIVKLFAGKRGIRLAKRLVEVGLWEPHPDGWAFHDWHDHQSSREERSGLSAVRAAAGRKGGQASGEIRRSRGWVYFFHDEREGLIKIGYTANVERRLRQIENARRSRLIVLGACRGTFADEQTLHDQFSATRIDGEWFRETPELLALIDARCADNAGQVAQ